MASKANQIVDDALAKAKQVVAKIELAKDAETGQMAQQLSRGVKGITGEEALEIGRRALNAYIDEEAKPITKDINKLRERVEILDGTRSNSVLGKRAVRFDHIRALSEIPNQPPKSRKTEAAAPTKEDFNAMFDDLRLLYNTLSEIAVQIRSHGTDR